MSKAKSALGVIAACALLFGACGGGEADAYCDALRDLMTAAPAEISTYLVAVEKAAAAAPKDQADALRDYASALRIVAADRASGRASNRMLDALSAMRSVEAHGVRECGLDFGAPATRTGRIPAARSKSRLSI